METVKKILPSIHPAEYKPHYTQELSSDEYHGMHEYVSSTGLKRFAESAQHFLNAKVKDSKQMKFGRLAHLAILEPKRFKETLIMMPDFGAMQSPKNRAAKSEWLASLPKTATAVKEDEMVKVTAMIEAIKSHKVAAMLLERGIPEVSCFFKDEDTDILCKVRPDFICEDTQGRPPVFVDIKTTSDPGIDAFNHSVFDRMYDLSASMYKRGIKACFGREFMPVLVAIESEPPHSVCVYPLSHWWMECGETVYKKAMQGLRASLDTNEWPGLQTEAQDLVPTEWQMKKRGIEIYE